jgi:Bacterial Ig domain
MSPFARVVRCAAVLTAASIVLLVAVPSASAQSAGWQAGPGAILDNTYDGYIDVPSAGSTVPGGGSFTVAGWFIDKTAEGWAGADEVQVWQGTLDGGGRMLARAAIAQSRPDVGSATGNPYWLASGFEAAVAGLPAGSQTLNVYAHTPGKGWWFKSVTVNGGGGPETAAMPPAAGGPAGITIFNPENAQDVSTRSDYTINGRVTEASNVDFVDVWINGERDTRYASQLGTVTPNADGSWSLTFNPTRFPSMHSILYIYAHQRNGQEILLAREINITDK